MSNKNVTVFKHNGMNLTYLKTENGLWQESFTTDKNHINNTTPVPLPNFQLGIAGIPFGFHPGLTQGYSALPSEMLMDDVEHSEKRILFKYSHKENGLAVEIHMELIPGTSVIRQTTTVKNNGKEPVVLNHLSSMFINGIAADGVMSWNDNKKIRIYYCMQTWNGEGQWRYGSLEELGLYPTSIHPCASAVHFSSVGSWSTGRYLPMVVLEDMETSKIWYFQVETSSNWHLEIGYRSSWQNTEGSLYLHADGADESFGGWSKKLLPGESFTTVPAAYGCCSGNFNDAIKELTKYRRYFLKPENAWSGDCPLFFNDYMNCLWADPTKAKLLPLIDAASEAGAEGFCIDAGWFGGLGSSWNKGLGDWHPSKDRFGEKGLKGILDYIKDKGMIPGVWLEMEVCGEDSELGSKPDSWFLMRHGARVGGGERWFLNFSNPEVKYYIHNVIDNLVSMGVGYIKNDYNRCIGNGDDSMGGSAADGLLSHSRAFYSFIDEIRRKHPRLIMENCGSGGMREDYGILSHFHLQSCSDQEIYHNNPSILGGSLAGILPEQLGLWAYPYPLLFENMNKAETLIQTEYQEDMADGEQTIFNMINGFCGNMYLSGHLEVADNLNINLIKEGIALYKAERKHLHSGYPIWPLGFLRINDKKSWTSIGIANDDNTRVLLAVWRLGSADEYMELPIHGWRGKKATVRQIYPQKGYTVDYFFNEEKGALTIHLPKPYTARYFEIVSRL